MKKKLPTSTTPTPHMTQNRPFSAFRFLSENDQTFNSAKLQEVRAKNKGKMDLHDLYAFSHHVSMGNACTKRCALKK